MASVRLRPFLLREGFRFLFSHPNIKSGKKKEAAKKKRSCARAAARCIFHEKRRFATVFFWKRLGSVSGFHLADTAAANECAVKFYQVILAFTE